MEVTQVRKYTISMDSEDLFSLMREVRVLSLYGRDVKPLRDIVLLPAQAEYLEGSRPEVALSDDRASKVRENLQAALAERASEDLGHLRIAQEILRRLA